MHTNNNKVKLVRDIFFSNGSEYKKKVLVDRLSLSIGELCMSSKQCCHDKLDCQALFTVIADCYKMESQLQPFTHGANS